MELVTTPTIAEADLLAIAGQLDNLHELCSILAGIISGPYHDRDFLAHMCDELGSYAGDVAQELRDVIDAAIDEASGPVIEAPALIAEAA